MNETNSQEEQAIKETCPLCGEFEGTKREVGGHKIQCTIKHNKAIADAAIDATVADHQAAAGDRKREEPDRTERVPLGVRRQRLSYEGTEPGFHYHWMNDNWPLRPTRIKDAEAAGYVTVEGVPQRRAGAASDGSSIMATLMRIPERLYDEDQAEKDRLIDEEEASRDDGNFVGADKDKFYVPNATANRGG